MPALSVVDKAAQAVEAADKKPPVAVDTARVPTPEVPESAEVAAAPKAAASKKYSDEVKAAAKRAEQLRGKARSVGPVQVERVKNALGKTKPEDVVGSFKSMKAAASYAGGDKDVKPTDLVKQLSKDIADPFAASRGLVAVCFALMGK